MSKTEYTIGKGRAPSWCSALLTPYRKLNGTIGYEYRGHYMDFDLNIGDKLILNEHGRITVVRRGRSRR